MTCEDCGNSGPGYEPIIEGKCSPCYAGDLYAAADLLEVDGRYTQAAKLYERGDDITKGIER